jgi:DNA-binding transcriptional LysR family regulator
MTQNETKYMECAIALAEKLHFTRAAQVVGLSQPMLTKNIQDLEKIVGCLLFNRVGKTVALNDAGRAYVAQARLGLLYGERAVQATRAVMQGADVSLHIGRSPNTDPFFVTTLLSIQLPLFPTLSIDWCSESSYDLVHDLLAGSVDLALVTEPPESPLLTTVQIGETPFYIAMSNRDELASHPSVSLSMMANRRWFLFERRLHPPLYNLVVHLAEERGIHASKFSIFTVPEETFPSAAEGAGVAFLVKSGALRMARNGVTVRPLDEERLRLRTYLASRADNESKVASELVMAFMRKISNINESKQLLLPI